MQDRLITVETSKLAKEKGFDIPVYYHYSENPVNDMEILCEPDDPQVGQGWILTNYNDDKFIYKKYSAPTQALLQKWLREVHNIDIIIYRSFSMKNSYHYDIIVSHNYDNDYQQVVCSNRTYETSLEQALKDSLILIT